MGRNSARLGYGKFGGNCQEFDGWLLFVHPARRSRLLEAARILDGIEGIEFVRFDQNDVVRHPVVQHIIQAYEANREPEGDRKEKG